MSQRRLAICSYRVSDILILGGKFSYLRVELGFTDWIDSISLCYSRPSTKLIDTDPKPFLPIIWICCHNALNHTFLFGGRDMYVGVVVVMLYINTQIHNFFVPYSMSRILESILQLFDSQRSQLFSGRHRKRIDQFLLGCQRKRKPPGMVNFHLSFPPCAWRKLLTVSFLILSLMFSCLDACPKHVPCRRPAKIDLSGKWSQCIFA